MAKQTFTTGQVLTAAQMTSLQQTAMGGGSPSVKTTSYVLVAADAGTVIQMNAAGSTTITVNTSLFSAGDSVQIQNIGAGVCTITAGTATVNTASSLALAQYESGNLYFTAASAAIFSKADGAAAGGGGKVLQVVQATSTTATNIASTSFTDTNLSATITPTLSTSKILIMFTQTARVRITSEQATGAGYQLLRGATVVFKPAGAGWEALYLQDNGANTKVLGGIISGSYLDSPATTSATTYKTQSRLLQTAGSASVDFQENTTNTVGTMILMEIGA